MDIEDIEREYEALRKERIQICEHEHREWVDSYGEKILICTDCGSSFEDGEWVHD